MEMSEITNFIANYGFPIVCVFFLWRYVSTTLKEFTDKLNDVMCVVKEMKDAFTMTIAENTRELERLYDRMERMNKDNDES